MRFAIYPFCAFSAVGLAAGVALHIVAWAGFELLSRDMLVLASVGMMIAAVPAILAAQWISRDYPQKDIWKAALRGAPAWMYPAVKYVAFYAMLNFILFAITEARQGQSDAPLAMARLFSAYWLAFYGYSFATYYSLLNLSDYGSRRCPSNHVVPPEAEYCPACGIRLTPDREHR